MNECFVKQCYGKVWHFCMTRQGLCYCIMTSEVLTNYEILAENATGSFDVCIDDNDGIHLVYQTKEGEIVYACFSQKQWNFETVLKSRNPSAADKNIKLIRVNNWLNILYTIGYKGKKLLTHQIINAMEIEPTAIDVTSGEFSVTADSQGNICVCYHSESSESFGIRKYIWSRKEWSDFTVIEAPSDLKNTFIFADKNDALHIAGTSDGKVVCIKDKTEILGHGTNPIIIEKDSMYVLWENNGTVSSAISDDGGVTYKNSGESMSGRFQRVKKYNIRFTSYEKGYKANCAYGYITEDNAVFLYFLKEFFMLLKSPPKPVPKSIKEEARKYTRELKKEKLTQTELILELSEKADKIIHRLDILKAMLENLK